MRFSYSNFIPALIYLVAEIALFPAGDFAINDDWAYGNAVQSWIENGELQMSFWQAIPAWPQLLAGTAFCKLFGFSYFTLRLTSILSLLISLVVMSRCLELTGAGKELSVFLQLFYAFNPIVFELSNTFMPESMLGLWCFCSLYFMVRYFNSRHLSDLALFTLFTVMGALSRQSFLVIPGVFCIVILWKFRERHFLWAFMPVITAFAALKVYEHSVHLPANYGLQVNSILHRVTHPDVNMVRTFSYHFTNSLVCLGLFLLPLVNWTEARSMIGNRKMIFLLLAAAAWVILKVALSGRSDPNSGNMMYVGGLGPVYMSGYSTDQAGRFTLAPGIILNLAGMISFVIFCSQYVVTREGRVKIGTFTVFCSVIYISAISFNYANDRYLIFLLPLFVLCLSAIQRQALLNKAGMIILFVFFLYSFLGTRDLVELSKARQMAADHFLKQVKAEACDVNGGFEFSGRYCTETKSYDPRHSGAWWWRRGDGYVISAGTLPGYVKLCQFPVKQFLREDKVIYCLKKE